MLRCENCLVRFCTHWGLRQHMVAAHPETVTLRCRVCNTPFSNRADLDRHVAMEGHYSGLTSVTVRQVRPQDEISTTIPSYYTAQPKVRSATVIPHKDLERAALSTSKAARSKTEKKPTGKTDNVNQHSTKPYGEKSSTKTKPKDSLSGYTIPKKSRVTPDKPSYSGRKSTATLTNADSMECIPTGSNSTG